jgi:hypothetical protein
MIMLYVFFLVVSIFCFSPRLAGKASASCNYYWTDISQSISCRCEGKAVKRAARRELCRIIRDVESRIGFRTAHAPSPLRMVGAPQPLSCPDSVDQGIAMASVAATLTADESFAS